MTNYQLGLVIQPDEFPAIPHDEHMAARVCDIYRQKDGIDPDIIVAKIEYSSPGSWSNPRWNSMDGKYPNSRYVQMHLKKEALPLLKKYDGSHNEETWAAFQSELLTYVALPQHEPIEFDDQFPAGRADGTHMWQLNFTEFTAKETGSKQMLIKIEPITDLDKFYLLRSDAVDMSSVSEADVSQSAEVDYYYEVDDTWVTRDEDGNLEVDDGADAIKQFMHFMKTPSGKLWIKYESNAEYKACFKRIKIFVRTVRKKLLISYCPEFGTHGVLNLGHPSSNSVKKALTRHHQNDGDYDVEQNDEL